MLLRSGGSASAMSMKLPAHAVHSALLLAMLHGGCETPTVVDEPDAFRGRRDAFLAPDAHLDAFRADAGMIACDDNDACDDGVACNGVERCSEGFCVDGTAPSCADAVPCTVDFCDLTSGECVHRAPDGDGDGAADALCRNERGESLGTDCDDTDNRRRPGNLEVCDIGGIDEDCNLETRGGLDADLDGFEDARCCNPRRASDTSPNCGRDCNDEARSINPMGTETCNRLDDNCNGAVDEVCTCEPGLTRPCMLPGVCASGVEICTNGLVWSACTIAPEGADVCNGLDEDCDGTVDEGTAILCFRDADNDGFAEASRSPERQCPDAARTEVGRCPVDYTDRAPVDRLSIDCCDRDRRAYPGNEVFHTFQSYCSELGFDFNCDGALTPQITAVASEVRCNYPTPATCALAPEGDEWLVAAPPCGVGGTLLTGCFWFGIGLGDDCTFTPAGEIQACR